MSENSMRKRKISYRKEKLIHELERQGKIYIEPNIIQNIPKIYRKIASNEDELKKVLFGQIGDFPDSLIQFLINAQNIQTSITTSIKSGHYLRARRTIELNPIFILKETGGVQEEIVHMLDHLLGGQSDSLHAGLSAGYGINDKVEELGKEIYKLYKRGKFFDEYMGKNEREYLAQGVRYLLQEGDEVIEDLDSMLYNVIRNKFLNESFWRESL
ncbi:MAG: hypothetical protein K8T10_12405 [Candidatus Eremiobacteraeota bacterium]|nr:hypothetical protein [Candidatus Eremiobacteraeota bacterium]